MSKLTPKQELFCIEYLNSFNATQSAIKSGYSKKSAYQIGFQLLKNIEIQKRIKEMREELKQVAQVEAFDIIRKLQTIGFMSDDLLNSSPYKGSDVIKALDGLAKLIGLYEEEKKGDDIPMIKIDFSNLNEKPKLTKNPKTGTL